jgi:hypothetical protein
MTARRSGIRLTWSVAALVTVNLAAQGTGGIAAASDDWGNSPGRSVLVADAALGNSVLQEGEERIAGPHADDLTSLIAPASDIDSNITAWHATASCVTEACECEECRAGRRCADGHRCRLVDCDPPGLFQLLARLHRQSDACWTGRADALLLWRNAPRDRPLVSSYDPVGAVYGPVALNANQLDSTPAAGPRFSLFRTDACGNGFETTYLRAANFRSQRSLPLTAAGYALTPPGIYGNTFAGLDAVNANLGSMVQGLEVNHRRRLGEHCVLLAGLRWVEWQESLTIQDQQTDPNDPTIVAFDQYSTGCINSLYGLQIGIDSRLISLGNWLKLDGVVKAGGYYNNAFQSSSFGYVDTTGFTFSRAVTAGKNAAAGAFVGEVGLTAVVPLHPCLDLRVGYFGLWLEGLAQPTNQLSHQTLTQIDPPSGVIDTTGGTVLQGVSLGLEGRW